MQTRLVESEGSEGSTQAREYSKQNSQIISDNNIQDTAIWRISLDSSFSDCMCQSTYAKDQIPQPYEEYQDILTRLHESFW